MVIHGRNFIEHLIQEGVITGPVENITEVVITGNVTDVVRIRVEQVGTKNLITLLPKEIADDKFRPTIVGDNETD